MKRIFHRVTELYAWNVSGTTLLFREEDLRGLIEKYLDDLDPLLTLNLKSCIFSNTMVGGDEANYRKTEKLLSERLRKALRDGEPMTYVHGTFDTLRYLEDYLEVYRYLTRRIDYEVESMGDSSIKLFRVIPVKKQNLLQRLTYRLGGRLQAYNIPATDIFGLVGIPAIFRLHTNNNVFEFYERRFLCRARAEKDEAEMERLKEENLQFLAKNGGIVPSSLDSL